MVGTEQRVGRPLAGYKADGRVIASVDASHARVELRALSEHRKDGSINKRLLYRRVSGNEHGQVAPKESI